MASGLAWRHSIAGRICAGRYPISCMWSPRTALRASPMPSRRLGKSPPRRTPCATNRRPQRDHGTASTIQARLRGFASDGRFDGEVVIGSIDWGGAPVAFEIRGMLMKSIWNLAPFWTRAWVSSAKHFAPDFKWTLCVSHPEENGVVTTGSRDWDDYS